MSDYTSISVETLTNSGFINQDELPEFYSLCAAKVSEGYLPCGSPQIYPYSTIEDPYTIIYKFTQFFYLP